MSEEKKFPPREMLTVGQHRWDTGVLCEYISKPEVNALLAAKDAQLKEAEAALEVIERIDETAGVKRLHARVALAKLRGEKEQDPKGLAPSPGCCAWCGNKVIEGELWMHKGCGRV